MKVRKTKVPIEIRRLVANHLESVLNSEMGSEYRDVYLGDDICPIYRPDLKDVAYYQFEVKSKDGKSIGFILASADEHDFPIPHWSLETPPISTLLEKDAKKSGKKAAKIYKLDALAYLLEDEDGEEVARLGNMPGLLEDLPDNLEDFVGNITTSETEVAAAGENDTTSDKSKHKIKRSKNRNPRHKMVAPGSWKELKNKFGVSFKKHLDLHKKQASKTWDTEKLIRKFGEGVFVGVPFYVPLLDGNYSYEITGEGKKYVSDKVIKRQNKNDAIELICTDPKAGKEVDFSIHIKYGTNEHEKLDFFIVTEDLPSNERTQPELLEV